MEEERRRFEAQVLPHLDAACNFARWLTRSASDADDIVQEAMLRAYRGFDGFRGADVKPWLLAIVRNCFLTAHRRKQYRQLPENQGGGDAANLIEESDGPEMLAMRADHGRKLHLLLAAMPDEFREVLVLREMEYLSYREIARITGAPMGTVMSRLARARALLKTRWLEQVEGVRSALQ